MSDIKLFRLINSKVNEIFTSKVDGVLYLIKVNTDSDTSYTFGFLREIIISRFISIGDSEQIFQIYYGGDSSISCKRSKDRSWKFISFDENTDLDEYTDLELIIKFGRNILDKELLGDLYPIIENIEI